MSITKYTGKNTGFAAPAIDWILDGMYGDLKAQRRDRNRKKLYTSEKFMFKVEQKTFTNTHEVYEYIMSILLDDDIQQYFNGINKIVTNLVVRPMSKRKKGGVIAYAMGDILAFSERAMELGEWIVLHELAHMVSRYHWAMTYPMFDKMNVTKNPAGHDALFAHVYLVLVEKMMGEGVAERLQFAMNNNSVPNTPNSKYMNDSEMNSLLQDLDRCHTNGIAAKMEEK